jgi:aconitate hydratase 2/2-methylisocitrate dehydratase
MQDAGALPIEMDVSKMHMNDVVDIYPYEGVAKSHTTGEVLAKARDHPRPHLIAFDDH